MQSDRWTFPDPISVTTAQLCTGKWQRDPAYPSSWRCRLLAGPFQPDRQQRLRERTSLIGRQDFQLHHLSRRGLHERPFDQLGNAEPTRRRGVGGLANRASARGACAGRRLGRDTAGPDRHTNRNAGVLGGRCGHRRARLRQAGAWRRPSRLERPAGGHRQTPSPTAIRDSGPRQRSTGGNGAGVNGWP